jgi:hypothetical protein
MNAATVTARTVTTRIRKAIREAEITTVLFVRTRDCKNSSGVVVWQTFIVLDDDADQQVVADCLGKAFGNVTVRLGRYDVSMTSPLADGPLAN